VSLLDPDHCGVSICARKLMPLFDDKIIKSSSCRANGMLEADAARVEFTERSIPCCQRIRLHGEEACLVRVWKTTQHGQRRVCQGWTSRSFTAVRSMMKPNKSPLIYRRCLPLRHLVDSLRLPIHLHSGLKLSNWRGSPGLASRVRYRCPVASPRRLRS
jgi:hypothetical protein